MNNVLWTAGGCRLKAHPIVDLSSASFPPYNIERFDCDRYRIVLGVAGYAARELEVIEEDGELIVRGATRSLASNAEIIRRLIEPSFERRFGLLDGFHLDDWIVRNGLLVIDIARDPGVPAAVELPPRRIDEAALAMPLAAA